MKTFILIPGIEKILNIILLSKSKTLVRTFKSIAQIKPKLKNKKIWHIKLRLSKVVEYFDGATSINLLDFQ